MSVPDSVTERYSVARYNLPPSSAFMFTLKMMHTKGSLSDVTEAEYIRRQQCCR